MPDNYPRHRPWLLAALLVTVVLCSLGILLVSLEYPVFKPKFINLPLSGNGVSRITLIFRYDDFSSTSEIAVEKELVNILKKFWLPCTFGIIPFVCQVSCHDPRPQPLLPLSEEKVDLIREAVKAGLIEVALHGFSHQTRGKSFWFGHSEFRGLSPKNQMEKIRTGKEYLERVFGCRVVTFIPPWNSYDQSTIMALEKLHFQYLSGRMRDARNIPTSLKFLPSTCSLAEVKDAIFSARKFKTTNPLICVTLHEYDFRECSYHDKIGQKGMRLADFQNLLAWIAHEEDVVVKNFKQVLPP